MTKLLFSYGGRDYYDDQPQQAVEVALHAAYNCSSKRRAWYWADKAVELCHQYFFEKTALFKFDLGQGSWPNTVDFASYFNTDNPYIGPTSFMQYELHRRENAATVSDTQRFGIYRWLPDSTDWSDEENLVESIWQRLNSQQLLGHAMNRKSRGEILALVRQGLTYDQICNNAK